MKNFAFALFSLAGTISGPALLGQALPAPTGLTVTAATNKKVDLRWTPGAGTTVFSVERRVADGTYGSIAAVTVAAAATTATYSDTAIDGMTAYDYRVRATAPLRDPSDPTNEWRVGPPPVGFKTLAPTPQIFADNGVDNHFGRQGQMILDSNEDPAVLYTVFDDDFGNGVNGVYFIHWNRIQYKWDDVVKVLPGRNLATYHQTLSLAQDRSTGQWGLFIETAVDGDAPVALELYLSATGASWTRKHSIPGGDAGVAGPGLAMAGGNVYLAYNRDYEGTNYVTGKVTDEPAKWTTQVLPPLAGMDRGYSAVSTAIALDSAGRPAVVYSSDKDYNRAFGMWRPGFAGPVKVIDTLNNQSDFIDVMLTFQGTKPVVLAELARGEQYYYEQVWSVTSNDGGLSWLAPAVLPRDGGHHSVNAPFDISVDSNGRAAALTSSNGGQGDDMCGTPKLSRSDALASWSTCTITDPDRGNIGDGAGSSFFGLRFNPNNKIYAVIQQNAVTPVGEGILFWRER